MKLRPSGKFISHAFLAGALSALGALGVGAIAQTPYEGTADFAKYAMKLRESAILNMEPHVIIPTTSHFLGEGKFPWKTQIVTTVFWIGEPAGGNNPVHNFSSSWDLNWESSYGGYDNPNAGSRRNFIPVNFVPRQNPFYIALPYNDVTHSTTKPEAKIVIPWFRELVERGKWVEGQSVCRNRWIAIRNSAGKICYAQWCDCGPFRTDHWQYVFGNEKPRPNLNGGAGLDVSPAVRDYLELGSTDATDWKFVEDNEVPNGPWALYGDNNSLSASYRRSNQEALASNANYHKQQAAPAPTPTPAPASGGPTIILHQQQ